MTILRPKNGHDLNLVSIQNAGLAKWLRFNPYTISIDRFETVVWSDDQLMKNFRALELAMQSVTVLLLV